MVKKLQESKTEIVDTLLKSLVKVWPTNLAWGIEENFNPNNRIKQTHDWNIGGRVFITLHDFTFGINAMQFKSPKVQIASKTKKVGTVADYHNHNVFIELGFEVAYFGEGNNFGKEFLSRVWVKYNENLLEDDEIYIPEGEISEVFQKAAKHIESFY